jgi:hypothetical protein
MILILLSLWVMRYNIIFNETGIVGFVLNAIPLAPVPAQSS